MVPYPYPEDVDIDIAGQGQGLKLKSRSDGQINNFDRRGYLAVEIESQRESSGVRSVSACGGGVQSG